MVRPALIEVGTGILAVGVVAFFFVSKIVAALLFLGGIVVTLYGFAGTRDDDD